MGWTLAVDFPHEVQPKMAISNMSQVAAFLWLATGFWQVVVALVVLRPTFRRSYPAFSSFASFAAIKTVILMVLPGRFYFLGYTIGSAATLVLLWATLFEVYTRVCGPNFSLPSWVPRTMASWLALAIGISAAATIGLYTVRSLPKRVAVVVAAQGGMLMALFLALIVLMAYSKHLGMEWRMRPKQLVAGLVIYFSVNTVVMFLVNHVPVGWAVRLDRTGQIALIIALIWWTFTLRKPEPAPEPVTQEIMDTILAFHRETMEAAESTGLVQ
jgi:hypothetical protein